MSVPEQDWGPEDYPFDDEPGEADDGSLYDAYIEEYRRQLREMMWDEG